MKYRGEIKNEKGEVIFSRIGYFENKKACLDALRQRVSVDIPDEYSLVHNIIHGGSFEKSVFSLKRFYKNASKLTFNAVEHG